MANLIKKLAVKTMTAAIDKLESTEPAPISDSLPVNQISYHIDGLIYTNFKGTPYQQILDQIVTDLNKNRKPYLYNNETLLKRYGAGRYLYKYMPTEFIVTLGVTEFAGKPAVMIFYPDTAEHIGWMPASAAPLWIPYIRKGAYDASCVILGGERKMLQLSESGEISELVDQTNMYSLRLDIKKRPGK